MSGTLHVDSPIIPAFPRRLSMAETTYPLSRIAESPKKQRTLLDSSAIGFPAPENSNIHSTLLDSTSNTGISSSTSSPNVSPVMPHENFPSCLSLENLGYESISDDWTEGWDIQEATAIDIISEQARLLELGDLTIIHEGDFNYIPGSVKVQSHCSDGASDRSLRIARDRLARQRRRVRSGLKCKLWLRTLLRKLGWSDKR